MTRRTLRPWRLDERARGHPRPGGAGIAGGLDASEAESMAEAGIGLAPISFIMPFANAPVPAVWDNEIAAPSPWAR